MLDRSKGIDIEVNSEENRPYVHVSSRELRARYKI
jgi:hypothetical protein